MKGHVHATREAATPITIPNMRNVGEGMEMLLLSEPSRSLLSLVCIRATQSPSNSRTMSSSAIALTDVFFSCRARLTVGLDLFSLSFFLIA